MALPNANSIPERLPLNKPYLMAVIPTGPGGNANIIPIIVPNSRDIINYYPIVLINNGKL